MKILFDYQAFLMQKYGGVSRCFAELIPFLSSSIDWKISVKQTDNVHLVRTGLVPDIESVKISFDNFIPSVNFRGKGQVYKFVERTLRLPSALKLNRDMSINMLKAGNIDVFHPTYFDDYFLRYIGDTPWVLTIHDMIPELFGMDNWQIRKKRKMASLASHIVAVSEHTKKDIINILGVPEEKISVVYHANSLMRPEKITEKYSYPYFLYVGDRSCLYKNFLYFLSEISCVLIRHKEIRLICTGKPFTNEENAILSKMKIASQVVHKYVSDEDLYNLYHNAIAFVYPSLYEGFGIPVLESFYAECPVILNNASCFPEIAGEAALYFDAKEGGLFSVLEDVLNLSEDDRLTIIRKGNERLSSFSWKESALQLERVYSLFDK